MRKEQWMLILGGVVLSFILLVGFGTKPESQKRVEEQRQIESTSLSIEKLIKDAKSALPAREKARIQALELKLQDASNQQSKTDALESLSAIWFEYNEPVISGEYATRVADIKREGKSWSIAGTTYVICVQKTQEDKLKQYCKGKAIEALQSAISLEPDTISHRVNLALLHVEYPPKDNPMKGILMLRDMTSKYPKSPLVLGQLGRLAIQTGQFEKAIERLSAAIDLSPERRYFCLLAEALTGAGKIIEAEEAKSECLRE